MAKDWTDRIERAHSVIDDAIAACSKGRRQVREVWGLFSGGHDSLASTSIASKHPRFAGVLHINTGIGIEQTREFVRETCRRHGWPLVEIHAERDCGQVYRDLVLDQGFPGPPRHTIMFQRLKGRALEAFTTRIPQPDRVALVSGRRSQESKRRAITVAPWDRKRRRVFVSPIHDWCGLDVTDYIIDQGLDRNPVVDILHMSGECLCGAFAHRGELAEIEAWFPDVALMIRGLETEVRAAGFDWGWEEGPSDHHPGQMSFADEYPDVWQSPLCSSCVARHVEAQL